MTASSSDAIAVLRIEIEYIEPAIWRRVAVRTSMNLKALHTISGNLQPARASTAFPFLTIPIGTSGSAMQPRLNYPRC
jgi:hypothetical protein